MKKTILILSAIIIVLTLCSCSQQKELKTEINNTVKESLLKDYPNTDASPVILYNGKTYYSFFKDGRSISEVWKPTSKIKKDGTAYFEILNTSDNGETAVYTFEDKSLNMFLSEKTAFEDKLFLDISYNDFPDYRQDDIKEIYFKNSKKGLSSKDIVISKKEDIDIVLSDLILASNNVKNGKYGSIPDNPSQIYEIQLSFKNFGALYIYGSAFLDDGTWKICSNESLAENTIEMSKESQHFLSSSSE